MLICGCSQHHQNPRECASGLRQDRSVDPRHLNIILITIDTLRSDRLSCYGSHLVETPNIDRFAEEGVLFRNAASTIPLTLPAHASILTGLYPPGHGVRENVGYSLGTGMPTIADLLSAEGWATAGFVSAFVLDRRWGVGRGFGSFFDDFDIASVELPNLNAVQRNGDVTIHHALRWIDRRPVDQPFFLWLHLYDPHDPYDPPEPYRSLYEGRPYDGEVAYTDALIGDFRRALEDRGVLDGTLVVLTADHGEGLGDHGEAFHGFFLYDTTIHVPLIMRLPAVVAAGQVVDTAVSHVDLLPTLLDAAAIELRSPVHGQSLFPVIQEATADPERAVYAESLYPLSHYGFSPLRALRSERFKFISAPRPELYATSDSLEQVNVAGEEPDVLRDFEGRLAGLRRTIEHEGSVIANTDVDAAAMARLTSLGYIAGRSATSLDEEENSTRADPKDKIGVHRQIMQARSRMRTEQQVARDVLVGLLERDPDIFDAHVMLGQMAAEERDFPQACVCFKEALALRPDDSSALMGLAGAYRFRGRNEEALVTLRRLLDVTGTNTAASLSIADIEVEFGRLEEAARVLERAVSGADAPAVVHNALGEIRVAQGRVDEAIGLFEAAASEDETLAVARFNLATLLEDRGDITAAVRHYEAAIALQPDYLEALFNLGRLMGRLGKTDRQQELWETAVAGHPDFVQGRYYLAKLVLDRGQDLNRAETLVRQGIEKDPNHEAGPFGYYLLAEILDREGRPDAAAVALTEGRRIQAASM